MSRFFRKRRVDTHISRRTSKSEKEMGSDLQMKNQLSEENVAGSSGAIYADEDVKRLHTATIQDGAFEGTNGANARFDFSARQKIAEDYEKQGWNWNAMMKFLHDDLIGQGEFMKGPFGEKQIIYCDWTASGRNLKCIEKYMITQVMTLYANTHTTTSMTGVQTTLYRRQARQLVMKSFAADSDEDCLIFCGAGVTAALYKIIRVLLKTPNFDPKSTIVFVGLMEHNSNLLMWREHGFRTVVIPSKKPGGIDTELLKKLLIQYKDCKLKIGSFTAASNVSGIVEDHKTVTKLLHEHGALSFWDFATAGPYLEIDMTNRLEPIYSKDAVFMSPHKAMGGPGAPGILCAKRKIFKNPIPVVPAGGTVFAAWGAGDEDYEYEDEPENREEGGTPDILGSIRAGLMFSLKDQIGVDLIRRIEGDYNQKFINAVLKKHPNIIMVGDPEAERLPIFSINVLHTSPATGEQKVLHCNYIGALFNDLFGIQGRPGCMCAGMYIRYELGIENPTPYMSSFHKDNELVRPGFFRLNFHFTLTPEEFEFVCQACSWVAKHAWKILPLYDINRKNGEYVHRKKNKWGIDEQYYRTLEDVIWDVKTGTLRYPDFHKRSKDYKSYSRSLKYADRLLECLDRYLPTKEVIAEEDKVDDPLQWYWLPSEVYPDVVRYVIRKEKPESVETQQLKWFAGREEAQQKMRDDFQKPKVYIPPEMQSKEENESKEDE